MRSASAVSSLRLPNGCALDGTDKDGKSQEIKLHYYVELSLDDHRLKMELGKLLIFLGIALVVAGLAVMLLGRLHLPVGRLPGDFLYRRKNTTVYFPLATSLLVSVVLTILLYVVSRWRR
jgi:hypothetical protein